MSRDTHFFREQAELQRTAAAQATLDNVRERCERAATSWEAMAARSELTERRRGEREARTAG
ncbi:MULTISPECIES: hypothetical protein [unclassified Sphingomonas]|jgi:hypothetical protein|uniref:hypothetical protein n=1 Tax=unclassified Sphingomonas TaxID=196159 RepID=UPI000E105847|nr:MULTISPECIES: hypothetical protein [unclassified Sphingomonas]AXJ96042.1 hypothetical protein DM480_11540 [Sphingomonas sp. FARSPH]